MKCGKRQEGDVECFVIAVTVCNLALTVCLISSFLFKRCFSIEEVLLLFSNRLKLRQQINGFNAVLILKYSML